MNSLFAKLVLVFLLLMLPIGALIVWVAQETSSQYSQEVTQRLNRSIAMYVTEEQQLIKEGVVDQSALALLAERAMTINPTVEIYILDTEGKILAHPFDEARVKRTHVNLDPIRAFLAGHPFPIQGQDPFHADQTRVFSVSPVLDNDKVTGYLYAILGGEKYQSVRDALAASFTLKLGITALIMCLVAAMLCGFFAFFVLTRRLNLLRQDVSRFSSEDPVIIPARAAAARGDEIDELRSAFHSMSVRITEQYEALRELDNTRRELIANVSHDLRTPLASLHGYLETLAARNVSLSATEQDYLNVAVRQSQRLSTLIEELFELARLDAGGVSIQPETFSLVELAFDTASEYRVTIEENDIELNITPSRDNIFVHADIGMIQRVLQNLIDNALRHTSAGGEISVVLSELENAARIEIVDTGSGIRSHDIPKIFERFYQSKQTENSVNIGTGLGLAIVKRILDLHESKIDVASRLGEGTSFTFQLPAATANAY